MARFELIDNLKQEIREEEDLLDPSKKEARQSIIKDSDDLWGMCEFIITTFSLRFPEAMAEFLNVVEEKRARSDKFGAPLEYNSVHKNMEARYEVIFPTAVVQVPDPFDFTGKRTITRYESLAGVLKVLFAKHGFPNFPLVDDGDKHQVRLFKEFFRRYKKLFGIAEVL